MKEDLKLEPGAMFGMAMNGAVPTYVKAVPERCELLEDINFKMMLNTMICFGPQTEDRFKTDEHLNQRDVLVDRGLAVKIVNQIYFVQTAATVLGLQTYLNHLAYMQEEHEKIHGKPDMSPKDFRYPDVYKGYSPGVVINPGAV